MDSNDWKRVGEGLSEGGSALLWLAVFLLFSVPVLFIVVAGLFH